MDEMLLRRAQKGDPAAFETLVAPLEARVYRTCVHLLGRSEDAADCAQEVLVKAWRTLNGFRGDCELSTWLHRLCVTTCLDALRREKLRRHDSVEAMQEVGFDPPDTSPGPAEALEKRERMAQTRAAIAALPEDQRLSLTLVALEGMTYDEAGALLGVTTGTVKSRVSRAREKLLKQLSAAEPSSSPRVQPSERRAP